ncbi:hypothetical protein [Pseudomonas sp. zfem005]|uniref:hypothetical protein n=1 Tax=Pseudomonas sp. zfem005 TaxID=3078200 RepID=UPI002928F39E|nr:hypothetical protein [Pseudomonas sp. zfem005]MDU9411178.1 hypothetical protein [Pseudomonas sp. zfem005]
MSITLREVRQAKELRPMLRALIRDSISCYADFTQFIHGELTNIFRDMVRSCHFFQKQSEDQITFHVISQFNTLGFRALHDPQIGGHVDICIEYDDYLWLAEAKIHTGYLHLQRGWEQLTSRYSTGMKNEDDGAFLIYNFNKKALGVTKEWRSVLTDFYPDVEIQYEEDELDFHTVHEHVRSGRRYSVKHYNIPLHHDPKDREL